MGDGAEEVHVSFRDNKNVLELVVAARVVNTLKSHYTGHAEMVITMNFMLCKHHHNLKTFFTVI